MAYLNFVPTGTILPYAGPQAPEGWLVCDGSNKNRSDYPALFDAISPSQICNTTNASTTVTVQDSSFMNTGMAIFGNGIPSGTTVSSVTNATTIIISAAATATQTGVSLRFSSYGVPSTTEFVLPDLRGRFLRGTSGVSTNDPNKTTRTAQSANGNVGNVVGSVQTTATKTPTTAFTTASTSISALSLNSTDLSHSHSFTQYGGGNSGHLTAPVGSGFASPDAGNGSTSGINSGGMSANSSHAHSLNSGTAAASTVNGGGDAETRPLNINVNYIIKI